MELTISQRKFSADGATKGKEMMAQLSDCINRRDFFIPHNSPPSLSLREKLERFDLQIFILVR